MKLGVSVLAAILVVAPGSHSKKLKGYRKPSDSTIVEKEAIGRLASTRFHKSGASVPRDLSPSTSRHRLHSNEGTWRAEDEVAVRPRAIDPDSSMAGRRVASSGLEEPFTAFQQCFASCGEPWNVEGMEPFEHEGSPTEAATESKKPPCCKGGVSALKTVYVGKSAATFFFLDDSLADLPVVDACHPDGTEPEKSISTSSFVKFADCDRCFPKDGSPGVDCNPLTDIWDSVRVEDNEEVCLVSFDEVAFTLALDAKMPKNLVFYYLLADSDTASSLTIHTSCSKPIYPPYAIRLGACSEDDNAYLDISVPGIQDLLANSSVLQFQDGLSAKNPGALFSTCDSPSTQNDETCCDGGASFLKMRFGGKLNGILTFDTTIASRYSTCSFDSDEKTSRKGKQPSKHDDISELRFVSCSDDCLSNPLNNVPCVHSFEMMSIQAEEEVCFGVWQADTNQIVYDEKMPTYVDIYFVPEDSTLGTFAAQIHTSCSKPLHKPYAQPFSDACYPTQPLFNLEVPLEDIPPHLAFLDGISRRYFQMAAHVAASHVEPIFDFTFDGCGCPCEPSEAPSCNPTDGGTHSPSSEPPTCNPSVHPSVQTSTAPSRFPSSHPSAALSSSPTTSALPANPGPPFDSTRRPSTSPVLPNTASPIVDSVYTRNPSVSPTSTKPSLQPTTKDTKYASDPPTDDPSSSPAARLTPLPSPFPSTTPSAGEPTNHQLGPGAPPDVNCSTQCKEWVYSHCVFMGDGGSLSDEACDIDRNLNSETDDIEDTGEDGRRFLVQKRLELLSDSDSNLVFQSNDDKREYHVSMVTLYREILSLLE